MRRNKGTFERDLELERQWMHRFTELKEIAIDVSEEEENDEDQVSDDEEEDDTEEGQGEEIDQDEKIDEEHVEEPEKYDDPEQDAQKEILLNLQPQDVSKNFFYTYKKFLV